jgi:tetratricopeptide (TPR) repeat protein
MTERSQGAWQGSRSPEATNIRWLSRSAERVRASLTRDHDLALAAVDRAMMINSTLAVVLGFDALTKCICGSYEAAIEHAEQAIGLSPLEPLVYHAAFALAFACLLTGRTEEGVAHTRKAIGGNRNFVFPYYVLALGCARLGQADEAAQTVRRLVRGAPRFRLGSLRRSTSPTPHGSNPPSTCCARRRYRIEVGRRTTAAAKNRTRVSWFSY